MISIYYLAIAFANILLSILGKSSTMLIPFFLALLALFCAGAAECSDKASKFFYWLCMVFGIGLAFYGGLSAFLTPVPIQDYTVALAQGICGLLVTVADPVIEKLKADG